MLKDFCKGFCYSIGAIVGACALQLVAEKIGVKVLEKNKEDYAEEFE